MYHKHPVEDIVAPIIEKLGFEIVRIQTIGNKNPTLQIMIERQDRKDLVVDDCAAVSRAISDILDEKDPIDGEYSLEVSSPGLDRPLTKPEHFTRFAGYEAKIETAEEVQGRKRFKGKIIYMGDDRVIHFDMDGESYAIPYDAVRKANLNLSDELLAEGEQAHSDEEL